MSQGNDSARSALRSSLQRARRQLSKAQIEHYSKRIVERLLPEVEGVDRLGGYLAFGAEVSLSLLFDSRFKRQASIYVPIIQPKNRMLFAPVYASTRFHVNKLGISEPIVDQKTYVEPAYLDAVVVPLVGFDKLCQRMGMGGGYYDRAFAMRKTSKQGPNAPKLIGVAFDCQRAETVYPESWDIPLDSVITENQEYSQLQR